VNNTTPGYFETIACANATPLSCGQTLSLDPASGPAHFTTTQAATLCLIHAAGKGQNRGQDQFCNNASNPSCTANVPIPIDAGANNPDPALQGKNNILRSDSIISVPVFNPVAAPPYSSVTIVGFLELGIVRVRNANPIRAIVMNAAGCGSLPTANPVSGGGLSLIPVRLIQPPSGP
jgi:hypothetical protein